jgi:hypothetical protein
MIKFRFPGLSDHQNLNSMPSSKSMLPSVSLKKASITLREDGIVQTTIYAEQELSISDVKEVIDQIAVVGGHKMLPQLIVAGHLSGPDLEAMRYIASPGSSPYAIAEAYVIISLSQKILARFYLNFNKPARPTKMFSYEKDAVAWLKEQEKIYHSKETNKRV